MQTRVPQCQSSISKESESDMIASMNFMTSQVASAILYSPVSMFYDEVFTPVNRIVGESGIHSV